MRVQNGIINLVFSEWSYQHRQHPIFDHTTECLYPINTFLTNILFLSLQIIIFYLKDRALPGSVVGTFLEEEMVSFQIFSFIYFSGPLKVDLARLGLTVIMSKYYASGTWNGQYKVYQDLFRFSVLSQSGILGTSHKILAALSHENKYPI